ncbi:class E sortase [Dehalobacter sp. DCM]|uniref:sortase n=1 Tax=Dehalobacter sp. DCM TaxID=2907827 RepID=UPI0030815E7F|nr:class E sortase [Dehalobacter sp. DCM]
MGLRSKKSINRISIALIIIGILVCLYPLYTNVKAYYLQAQLEKELNAQIAAVDQTDTEAATTESPVVENTAPVKVQAPPRKIDAMMFIDIPDINISAVVVRGTTQASLADGPGWYVESALPGKGNTAVAGHKNMYGSWFRNLYKLQAGDPIYITYKTKVYTYLVETVKPIAINDWSLIEPTEENVLTLTTCHTKTERLAVRAELEKITDKK